MKELTLGPFVCTVILALIYSWEIPLLGFLPVVGVVVSLLIAAKVKLPSGRG